MPCTFFALTKNDFFGAELGMLCISASPMLMIQHFQKSEVRINPIAFKIYAINILALFPHFLSFI